MPKRVSVGTARPVRVLVQSLWTLAHVVSEVFQTFLASQLAVGVEVAGLETFGVIAVTDTDRESLGYSPFCVALGVIRAFSTSVVSQAHIAIVAGASSIRGDGTLKAEVSGDPVLGTGRVHCKVTLLTLAAPLVRIAQLIVAQVT